MLSRIPEYEVELRFEKFSKSLSELKKKNGKKYDFILKAGEAYTSALFKLYKSVWDSESFPEDWRRTTIVQLPKGKMDPADLDGRRNIHVKLDTYKHFGQLVMDEVKGDLHRNMSKYQLGTKPGHRSQEHIYVLKSLISFSQCLDSGVIITLYDISKFFDRENIYDVLDEAFKSGVKGKAYRLLFEMNRKSKIKVKTPLGNTEEAETKAHLGQGTVEGAILSANSIYKGVGEYLGDENDINYGTLVVKSLLFQDDIASASRTIESAQSKNDKMEAMLETKLLDLNDLKSVVLVTGTDEFQKNFLERVNMTTLTIYKKPMKRVNEYSYLGISCIREG